MQDRDLNEYNPSDSTTSKHLSCSHQLCESGSNCKSPKEPCSYNINYYTESTSSSGLLVQDVLHLGSGSDDTSKNTSVQAPVIIGCVALSFPVTWILTFLSVYHYQEFFRCGLIKDYTCYVFFWTQMWYETKWWLFGGCGSWWSHGSGTWRDFGSKFSCKSRIGSELFLNVLQWGQIGENFFWGPGTGHPTVYFIPAFRWNIVHTRYILLNSLLYTHSELFIVIVTNNACFDSVKPTLLVWRLVVLETLVLSRQASEQWLIVGHHLHFFQMKYMKKFLRR